MYNCQHIFCRGSAPWQAGTPPGTQGPPPGWGQNGPQRSQTLDNRGGGRVPPPVRPKPQMRPQSSYGPEGDRRSKWEGSVQGDTAVIDDTLR